MNLAVLFTFLLIVLARITDIDHGHHSHCLNRTGAAYVRGNSWFFPVHHLRPGDSKSASQYGSSHLCLSLWNGIRSGTYLRASGLRSNKSSPSASKWPHSSPLKEPTWPKLTSWPVIASQKSKGTDGMARWLFFTWE